MAQHDLLAVVEQLYAAAIEPDLWGRALAGVSDAVGAVGTCIVPLDPLDDIRTLVSESIAEANADYEKGWWRHDTASARLVERGIRPGVVGTDRVVMSETEISRDPFYQEFRKGHGLGQSMAAVVSLGPGRLLSIAAQRGVAKGLYERDDVETLTRLAPHLGRAAAIASALVEARRIGTDMAGAMYQLAWGVVVLDTQGRVRSLNPAAEALMGDAFTIREARVHAARPDDDARLQQAIAAALPGSAQLPSSGVPVRRTQGRGFCHVEAVPIRPRLNALEIMAFGAGGTMLLIREPNGKHNGPLEHLRAMGLTPAEARLAGALGAGDSLRAVAEAQGIAYETARAHLRAIFHKLDVRRQSELVALLAQLGHRAAP